MEDVMSEPTLELLAKRVECLERSNRWLKGVCPTSVVGAGLLTLVAATQPSNPAKLDALQLTIVDKDGRSRMVLGTDAKGSPFMSLINKDKLAQLQMGLGGSFIEGAEEAPYVCFSDKQFHPRICMGLSEGAINDEGEPYFNMRSRNGKTLFFAPNPSPRPQFAR
jgi:hypothetical protein